ncbi:MAG: hypothetical protein EOO38_28925 [Cytophagaceae bacterium]|nr:MAG: hypothetical protein EOO38_28925 [Cytophagaceae bacterium]
MAKIIEQQITIRVSKLARRDGSTIITVPEGVEDMLESVVTELLNDPAAVVEVVVEETHEG